MELLCPAGSLKSLRAAIEHGADAVYIGFSDQTNARNFAGLNFSDKQLETAAQLAQTHKKRLHIAINTFAHPTQAQRWKAAVDKAVQLGADVLIVADLCVLHYCATHYPSIELHASVQVSATNAGAIAFLQQHFNVTRIVLPRVLSIHQIKQLAQTTNVELEVFAYGSLCIMAEGRCYLSSYLTGESPNTAGVCSGAKFVDYQTYTSNQQHILESRLNGVLIDRFAEHENAGYPTLCKGRFSVEDELYHALEEPTSLNSMELLPELYNLGIKAIKIEGRQRSPTYVRDITRTWRAAIDNCIHNPHTFVPTPAMQQCLTSYSEGSQTTLGAYHKKWK